MSAKAHLEVLPRSLQVVVHVNNGEPAAIEILPTTANAYSTAQATPMKFRWPTV